MKKKEKNYLVIILLAVGFLVFYNSSLSIADFSSNFYTKNGNNIVLTLPDEQNYGVYKGFNAVGINSGGRDWLIQFANQSLVLKPTCTISGGIHSNNGQFEGFPVNYEATASYDSTDSENLICELSTSQQNAIAVNFNGTSETKARWDSGTTVTWYFVSGNVTTTPTCNSDSQCLSNEMCNLVTKKCELKESPPNNYLILIGIPLLALVGLIIYLSTRKKKRR